jgi:hypothetical protein
MQYAIKATCTNWGAQRGARRVSGLTAQERAAVRAGADVRLAGCPPVRGITDRRIVEANGRFYARMPHAAR